MLERMDDFFTARINGYDEHMKSLFIILRNMSERGKYGIN